MFHSFWRLLSSFWADGDDLTYSWGSSGGTVEGSDTDTTTVEVRGGTLLVQVTGNVLAVSMTGSYFTLYPSNVEIEVVGTRIFTGPYDVRELNHAGSVISTVTRPAGTPSRVTSFAAFDGGFAFLENWGDTVSFVSESGTLLENVVMPEASSINQGLRTLVVGDMLIISETGTRKLVEADLTTREMSIFKDMSQLSTWLGDIDYSDGIYYMTQYEDIFEFTETGAPQVLYNIPDGFMLFLTVVGKYAYATDLSAGKIYKVDIFSGAGEVLVEGLASPRDIEFLPVALQAP